MKFVVKQTVFNWSIFPGTWTNFYYSYIIVPIYSNIKSLSETIFKDEDEDFDYSSDISKQKDKEYVPVLAYMISIDMSSYLL